MTIQINSTRTAGSDLGRVTEAVVGIDLSLLGAARKVKARAAGIDTPVEHMSFPALASAVEGAARGGLDFVALSEGFVTRSDHDATNGALDAARTAGRLIELADLGFSAQVPSDRDGFERSVELIGQAGCGWGCVELRVDANTDYALLVEQADRAHAKGAMISVVLKASEFEHVDVEALASCVDTVRLECSDPHEAREVRFALRSSAAEQGRMLRVLCEIGFIVSSSREAAEEREILLKMLGGDEAFRGKTCIAGTVTDVVDEAERWISAGATDGFVFLPASVPTDLASLIRGVMPLIRERHI